MMSDNQSLNHSGLNGNLDFSLGDDLEYLAEGNANVVFSVKNSSPACLVRVQKEAHWTVPVIDIVRALGAKILPLFCRAQYVEMNIKQLNPHYIEKFNLQITQAERNGKRPEKRRGVYVHRAEQYAILMQDMRPQNASQVTIEFKPKWLVQSPSAPTNAMRCRTCALRKMRASEEGQNGRVSIMPKDLTNFCPLGLLSNDTDILRSVVKAAGAPEDKLELFANALKDNGTIQRLRQAQQEHNNVGLQAITTKADMGAAMALRDCVMFVRVDSSSGQSESVLADLDIKKCDEDNYDRWGKMEARLVDEGWYEGTDEREKQRSCRLQALNKAP